MPVRKNHARPTTLLLVAGLLLLGSHAARATPLPPIDLTTAGAQYTDSQGAIRFQQSNQPTGTGTYDPFLRVQRKGVEEGFNTDASGVLDDKAGPWTHSLKLSDLVAVDRDGVQYYTFDLDINESANDTGSRLSLDKFQLYTVAGNNASIASLAALQTLGTRRYDLDNGAPQPNPNSVYMDYNASGGGSGKDDVHVWVPTSMFSGASLDDYLYLYSAFGSSTTGGTNWSSDAGFEEWRTRTNAGGGANPPPPPPPPHSAPEPGTVVFLANAGAVGLVASRMRKRRT